MNWLFYVSLSYVREGASTMNMITRAKISLKFLALWYQYVEICIHPLRVPPL
jgi:hypothetical protein